MHLLLLDSPNPRPCLDYQKYTFKICLRSGLQKVDIVCILEGAACGLSHQAQLMCISYLHYVGGEDCFVIWDKVSLCSSGWSWTGNSSTSASASQILVWQFGSIPQVFFICFNFFRFIYFYLMYMIVYALHVCLVPIVRGGWQISRTEIMDGCELPHGCSKSNQVLSKNKCS